MTNIRLTTNSPAETYNLGFTLGKQLLPGTVLCIEGEMGAGKTALSQGLIRGLGVMDKYITSPTYTLVNEYYVGDLPIYHFDIYRVGDYDELLAIGFDEYLHENSVVILEWADLIREDLPKDRIWITIHKENGDEVRTITIEGFKDIESMITESIQKEGKK